MPKKKQQASGAPGWLTTFSDLMSLLLCFFVLLLSFAELDVKKYKQISGSMKMAFGVQREQPFEDIPVGTDMIAEEFSSGEPQAITSSTPLQAHGVELPELDEVTDEAVEAAVRKHQDDLQQHRKDLAENLKTVRETLKKEIAKGDMEVESDGKNVVIRVNEDASFASGSAGIQRKFAPTLLKISRALKELKGDVIVAGHTDDIPIATDRFRSNWELSAGRAVSMAHALQKVGRISSKRMTVSGYADTRPLVPNSNNANRARNRRVEIVVGRDVYTQLQEKKAEGPKSTSRQ